MWSQFQTQFETLYNALQSATKPDEVIDLAIRLFVTLREWRNYANTEIWHLEEEDVTDYIAPLADAGRKVYELIKSTKANG